jgi:hypothetical protein
VRSVFPTACLRIHGAGLGGHRCACDNVPMSSSAQKPMTALVREAVALTYGRLWEWVENHGSADAPSGCQGERLRPVVGER